MGTRIEAHMTGTVFRVETSVGARVSEGDELIIIESMKMELPVESPASGVVKTICVEEGQSIEEGDVLLELE